MAGSTRKREQGGPTVDGNGNALRESEAILAEESGDLAELVGLEVLDSRVGEVSGNDVQVEAVGLRNRLDGGGAGVVLRGKRSVPVLAVVVDVEMVFSYIALGEESSENHLDCVPDGL